MICQSVKAGFDCAFMGKNGCLFPNGTCGSVIDKCEGCGKVIAYETGQYCKVYADPASKWLTGRCPMATHVKLEIRETQKINPLKASKRSSKKA